MRSAAPLGLALLFFASPLFAQASAEARVEEAERLYAELLMSAAAEEAEAALASPDASDAVRARAHRVLGKVAASRGDFEAARAHFRALLEHDPDATLEGERSPKILLPFDAAKADVRAAREAREQKAEERAASEARAATEVAPAPAPAEAEPPFPTALVFGAVAAGALVVVVAVGGTALFLATASPPCEASLGCTRAP